MGSQCRVVAARGVCAWGEWITAAKHSVLQTESLAAAAPPTPHPLNSMVVMLNPSVGLMVLMSSPFRRLTMVVLPALSRPLEDGGGGQGWPEGSVAGDDASQQHQHHQQQCCQRRRWRHAANRSSDLGAWGTHTISSRISFSLRLTFLIMVSSPMAAAAWLPPPSCLLLCCPALHELAGWLPCHQKAPEWH